MDTIIASHINNPLKLIFMTRSDMILAIKNLLKDVDVIRLGNLFHSDSAKFTFNAIESGEYNAPCLRDTTSEFYTLIPLMECSDEDLTAIYKVVFK